MHIAARARERLAGHWQEAVGAQCLEVLAALLLLLLGWYADRTVVAVSEQFAQPFRLLLVLFLCLLDLLVRSPIRAGQAVLYRALNEGETGAIRLVFSAFRLREYAKAVALRAALWGRRIVWYTVAFLPTAFLLACGDLLREGGINTSAEQITYLLLAVVAGYCLLVGLFTVELHLLRYMPAWYLLRECATAREAMRRARQMMKGHIGEAAWMYAGFSGWLFACLCLFPYFYAAPLFGAARAAWVAERRICA